tara:strand:- start:772 stop:1581 length:810 start_codon:yes stop_codon:yes gene_type:complete
MFKTDDKIIEICMAISFLIVTMYGVMMFFDPNYILSRYDSGTNPDEYTMLVFITWFGMFNLGAAAGIIYMGYKGLDRAYFAYVIPLLVLLIYWNLSPAEQSGNYTGVTLLSINLIALLIARYRSGFGNPFNMPKADQMWGVSDGITKGLLWLALIGQSANVLIYIVDPGNLINNTGFLEMSANAQHFAFGMMLISIAWIITLLFQLRTGLSMTMVVVALVISTLWWILAMNFLIANNFETEGGNMLLAVTININFFASLIIFFRNQSNF